MNENKKSIALGTFDGFHLGHQKVIELSKKSGYMPYVLLFSVHPLKCIKGEAPPEILTDGLRKSLLGEMNVGALEIDFSEIMHLSPESFVVTASTSGRRRRPRQDGHGLSLMTSSISPRDHSLFVSR